MKSTTWEGIWGIVRTILVAVGSWFIGKTIFNHTVDNNILEISISAIGVVGAFVWTVLAKTLTEEMLQGTLRQLITGVGGVFVAFGKLKAETLVTLLGLVTVIAPPIYAWISRLKSKRIANQPSLVNKLTGNKP